MGDNGAWLLAGGAALGSLLAAFWSNVRAAYQILASRVVMSLTLDGYQAEAMQCYLRSHFAASSWGPRSYIGWMLYVRPRNRVQVVAMETSPPAGRIYWLGWRALWVGRGGRSEHDLEDGVTASSYQQMSLQLCYVRGLFDPDRLVTEATDFFNRQVYENTQAAGRHHVKHIHGTAGKMRMQGATQRHSSHSVGASHTDLRGCLQYRPLGFAFHQLGTPRQCKLSAVEELALSPEATDLATEALRWKDAEQWYRQRGLPWRRGWLLWGEPGTGKTAFARAVAEDLDLPVFAYDLASLHNDELQREWSAMLTEVPCMALLEDIDAIFHGRENIVAGERGGLTFDALLNCLDGVQRADGLLVVLTTNCLDRIDPAIGQPIEGRATRPGRVDRVVEFAPIDEAGRHRIAHRILPDHPQAWNRLVIDGAGETGAQFQERCAQRALELEFGGCVRSVRTG